MRYFTRSALCLLIALLFWQTAGAGPWVVANNPDPQPSATFVPDRFSAISADGYWAAGTIMQSGEPLSSALIRFDANGQQQARSFVAGGVGPLLRLADGGVLSAASGATVVPGELGEPFCQVTRLTADGRTQWQIVFDGNACLAVDSDAAGEIWVGIGTQPTVRLTEAVRLRDDGSIAARVALDDPLQVLVEMRADPAGAGVILAGHRVAANDPQSARAQILRLRADGSVDWNWQSGSSANASSVKFLRVSASAGIYAISSRFLPDGSGQQTKDWLATGLSLSGVQRFENKISFSKAVAIVGSSGPDAAGLWLALQRGSNSDGSRNATISVVRLSAAGKLGNSDTIRDAYDCFFVCQMALRRDGGLWLLISDRVLNSAAIVGVDGNGSERARLAVLAQSALGLLPDDRALGVTGQNFLGPVSAMRIGFNQPAELASQLVLPARTLAPTEAVAGDGAVAQWRTMPFVPVAGPLLSNLSFRASDTDPIAWRVEFSQIGDMQLSVSPSLVCMAGVLIDRGGRSNHLECRRRTDGSLLWQDDKPQPATGGQPFLAISALPDTGGAVAISSEPGNLVQWLIGGDGQVLATQATPLRDANQRQLQASSATFNAQGDALLTGWFDSGFVLRLDRDGQIRFQTALTGLLDRDLTAKAVFTDDGGAIVYSKERVAIARYLASGIKQWEVAADRSVADLQVIGDTIVYTMRSLVGQFSPEFGGWAVVALDGASGGELWRLPFDSELRASAGIVPLPGQRLAVLNIEGQHLRYRELDIASGALLREQTDMCAGEVCTCEGVLCLPRSGLGNPLLLATLPLQRAGGRLRARVGDLIVGSGWGSSVLLLDDAGQTPNSVRADQTGVSGSWFAPWATGQGLIVDWIAGAHTLFASWLTFSAEGGNDPSELRWYTLQGELADGSQDAEIAILSSEGGRFGVGINQPRQVGTAHLVFENCARAQFNYRFDADVNGGRSGQITLSQLAPAGDCIGAPSAPPVAPPLGALGAGIDGAWFEPANSGQGLMFDAFPAADTLFATWFTYDPEGAADDPTQQHWLTLQGPLGNGAQSTLTIVRTIGGRLIDRPTANSQRVGTATVVRLGCDRLRLDYQFDDSDLAGAFRRISGSRELQRIGGCAN